MFLVLKMFVHRLKKEKMMREKQKKMRKRKRKRRIWRKERLRGLKVKKKNRGLLQSFKWLQ